MNIHDKIKSHLLASAEVKERVALECLHNIEKVISEIVSCFEVGNKLLICGNGGSAADAQGAGQGRAGRQGRRALQEVPA